MLLESASVHNKSLHLSSHVVCYKELKVFHCKEHACRDRAGRIRDICVVMRRMQPNPTQGKVNIH
jgi:hypothetical protein